MIILNKRKIIEPGFNLYVKSQTHYTKHCKFNITAIAMLFQNLFGGLTYFPDFGYQTIYFCV